MNVSELWPVWPEAIERKLSAGDQAHKDMLDGLAVLFQSPLIKDLRDTAFAFPASNIGIALNKKQTACKKWLVESLLQVAGPRIGSVHLLAGWYGLLGAMLLNDDRFAIDKLTVFDIDESCRGVANGLNRTALDAGRFEFRAANIMDLDYRNRAGSSGNADLIVNTSCEHIDDFAAWYALIPSGQLLALQSNDYFAIPEHVNCSGSLAEFALQAPMKKRLFEGELVLPKYRRFMLIGRK